MSPLPAPAGGLGVPDDPARWLALGAAIATAWLLPRFLGSRRLASTLLPACALLAALLSASYVAFVLRGGPRIIDATSYWLQARALADGWLAFPLAEPEQSVLGRFLVRAEAPTTLHEALAGLAGLRASPGDSAGLGAAAVIFPPGYPALLALGFAAGAPLAVGPLLAAALVVATAALGSTVEQAAASDDSLGRRSILGGPHRTLGLGPTAAIFSMLSATLRYHTADTMSHGLAALCFTVGLTAAARLWTDSVGASRTAPRHRLPLLALLGLAIGWLFATRPVSAAALLCTVAVGAWGCRGPTRRAKPRGSTLLVPKACALVLGASPGVVLWLAHQHAATGSAWGNAQALYYSLSDGPTGCFRYGFGSATGCLGEHGTFVQHHLSDGYGLGAALGTTARRLQHHLSDALNFSPLWLLVPLGAWLGRGIATVRLVSLGVLALLLAYVPFYFDGNYPGGGARMLADALPLEHVLAATALARLAALAPAGRPSGRRLVGATAGLALGGFALQSGTDHALLRERDGGRPMFEPAKLAPLDETAPLVLLETDHGLNLALRPGSRRLPDGTSPPGPSIRRYRGDGLDRLSWEWLGRPATYRYRFEPGRCGASPGCLAARSTEAWLEPVAFDERPLEQCPLRIEAESLWPPTGQQRGWAWPTRQGASDASADGWLRVRSDETARRPARALRSAVRLALPSRGLGGRSLGARVRLSTACRVDGASEPASASAAIEIVADTTIVHRWSLLACDDEGRPTSWRALEPCALPPTPRKLEVVIRADGEIDIDYFDFGPRTE